jgi:glycosyltransferase involved in cell wall biosynthesis
MSAPRICYFGIYDSAYPRNDILLSGLRACGVPVLQCQADWREKNRYRILRKKLRQQEGNYDILYAAHPAAIPVILGRVLSRKPVVMDALYSMYDAVVNDRQEVPWYHPRALRLLFLDWLAAFLSTAMVVDTLEHREYWSRLPFIRKEKIFVLYTGVQEKIFYPSKELSVHSHFLVSFHGFYIPLQGVDTIVEAARLLADDPSIRFRLIGAGQLSKKVGALIEQYKLSNIEEVGKKTPQEIARLSQESDIVLGIFGNTAKARRVVPNKVYEAMGMQKPVITMDSPAIREIFSDDDALLIQNTPEALAEAIRTLQNNPDYAARLARHGYEKVSAHYAPKPLAQQFIAILSSCLP